MTYEEMLEEKSRDYSPMSTPAQIKEFMSTVVYQDFINELNVRIEQMRDYYEDCNKAEYLETRGGIKLIRLMKEVFLNLHDNAEADLEFKDEEDQNVETV